jgi:restriction system protein
MIADLPLQPLKHFFLGLTAGDRLILYLLLAASAALGFFVGWRRSGPRDGVYRVLGGWRLPMFQNSGEALVSRVLRSHFGPPDYHLMNHVTIRMDDGTTQVDHVLVSRFGVFVIETKDFSGWIFAKATDSTWTQVHFRRKVKFQNPLHQNFRHVRAVQGLLDFLPPEAVKSVVVFSGDAEFKTPIPEGVLGLHDLAEYLTSHTDQIMSRNRLQFCVGRLETARLAISRETDVAHIESLAGRFGGGRM